MGFLLANGNFLPATTGQPFAELLREYHVVFGFYTRAKDLFARLQEYGLYRIASSTNVQDSTAKAFANKLRSEIEILQKSQLIRLSSYHVKINLAADLILKLNRVVAEKDKAKTESRVHALILGEMFKPKNSKEDWERDSNCSRSTNYDGLESELQAAHIAIEEYNKLVDCIGIFCRGLEWAVDDFLVNAQVNATEARPWTRCAMNYDSAYSLTRCSLYFGNLAIQNQKDLKSMLENVFKFLQNDLIRAIREDACAGLACEAISKSQDEEDKQFASDHHVLWNGPDGKPICKHCGHRYHPEIFCRLKNTGLILQPTACPFTNIHT